jgi:hypothetical protein
LLLPCILTASQLAAVGFGGASAPRAAPISLKRGPAWSCDPSLKRVPGQLLPACPEAAGRRLAARFGVVGDLGGSRSLISRPSRNFFANAERCFE